MFRKKYVIALVLACSLIGLIWGISKLEFRVYSSSTNDRPSYSNYSQGVYEIENLVKEIQSKYPKASIVNPTSAEGTWELYDSGDVLKHMGDFELKLGKLKWDKISGPDQNSTEYIVYCIGREQTSETAYILAEVTK